MSVPVRVLRVSFLAATMVPIVFACGDSGESDNADVDVVAPDGASDAPSVPDAADDGPSSTSDASIDAGVTVDGDAGADAGSPPRTCSTENWCHVPVPDGQVLNAVWGDGKGVVWTVSSTGRILRWNGAAWVQSYPDADAGPGAPLNAVWGSSSTDIWVGGFNMLLHGTGASPETIAWTAVPTPVPVTVRSVWGTGPSDVWAVGYTGNAYGSVLHHSGSSEGDADAGWTVDPVTSAFPTRFVKVWGTSADDVWLGGIQGNTASVRAARALHGRLTEVDGGVGHTWTSDGCAAGYHFNGAASVNRSTVYLLGFSVANSALTKTGYCVGSSSDDGGTFTWSQETFASANTTNFDAWGTSSDDVWVVGDLGRLRHWDGTSWRTEGVALDDVVPVVRNLYGIWGSKSDDVWVVGDNVSLHKVGP